MQNQRLGLIFGLTSFTIWGLFPAYFKLLIEVSPVEILAHRIIWSFIFLFFILKFKSKFSEVSLALKNRKNLINLAFSSLLISLNWGIYIYAVSSNQITQASFGYFINPLISIIIGAIFLKERLNFASKLSIPLVFVAILIQIYILKGIPLISLGLALSFAFYSLVKKREKISSFVSLFLETMMIVPFSFLYLSFIGLSGDGKFGFDFIGFLLIFSGIVTIIPLVTFGEAAKNLNLTTLGFLQYIAPSLSLLIAIFVYNERLEFENLISFILIWCGLLVVSLGSIKRIKNG